MNSKHPLSPQEVTDFMHKLSTESRKVLVLFFNTAMGVSFTLPGRLQVDAGGTITVHRDGTPPSIDSSGFVDTPGFVTTLSALLTVPCEFADPRAFKSDGSPLGALFEREPLFTFSLVFIFPNGSLLIFMEVNEAHLAAV
jgi:hypothetical protein